MRHSDSERSITDGGAARLMETSAFASTQVWRPAGEVDMVYQLPDTQKQLSLPYCNTINVVCRQLAATIP